MVVFTSLMNFGFSFYLGEYVLFLRARDHLSAGQIGLALGLGTLGLMTALVVTPRMIRRRPAWLPLWGALAIAAGIATVTLWTHLPGLIVGDMTMNFGTSVSSQIVALTRQRLVQMSVMGSVSGALSMFHTLLVPLGMALAGLLAEEAGAGADLWTAAALVGLSLVVALPFAKAIQAGPTPAGTAHHGFPDRLS
jgi:hypothetical protein